MTSGAHFSIESLAMRWGLLVGAAGLGAMACRGAGFFVCNEDLDCGRDGDGNGGICEPTGACSFPDDDCNSGRRYGDSSSPSIAGECVPLGVGSEESGGWSTTGAGDDPSLEDAGAVDTTAGACGPDWWDCAWSYRQRLVLGRPVVATLQEVPLLVLLADGRVDHDRMQADGEDVRFVSASGAVAPHEIEHWDPQGVSTLWVNVDELGGAADHLWIYYGNPVAQNAEDSPGVWPAPHAGVWHLHGEPRDSTGYANHGVLAGNTNVRAGQVADGREFIDTDARVDIESSPSLTGVFAGGGTVSAWARAHSWGAQGYGRIAQKANSEGGWFFFFGMGGQLRFGHDLGQQDLSIWGTAEEVLFLQRWTYVAVTFEAGGTVPPRFYVDGVEYEVGEGPEPPVDPQIPSDLEIPLVLGNRPDTNRRFEGILDEVRIETAVRGPAWIAVQHAAMQDDLLLYGPIESQGGSP